MKRKLLALSMALLMLGGALAGCGQKSAETTTPVPETSAPVETTAQPTQEIQSYTKRVVKNLAELKEKILIFDLGYDDVAVELVKNALCTIIARTYQVNRVHAYFSRINEGEMEFAVFLPRKQEPVYHSTKLEVYRQSQEVLRSLDFVDPPGFARVDSKLARKLLQDYQNI